MDFPFRLPFIRWADIAIIRPSSPTSMRRLYDHELVYVLGGRGRITIERAAYQARDDQLFLIPPRVWHSFVAGEGAELTLLGVHFDWAPRHDTSAFPLFRAASEPVDGSLFRPFHPVPHWNLHTQPFLDLKGRPRARRMLEEIVLEYSTAGEQSRVIASACLAALLTMLPREAQALVRRDADMHVGWDTLRRVEKARLLLEGPRILGIDEVAAHVGWSGDHMRKMFRKVLGTNPAQIQMQARLNLARTLLREANLSIGQVAHECGFDDHSHFTRTFKKDSGLSPRQFVAMSKNI